MGSERIKVLYIAGWGRSGSTILDNVLGQIDGLFSAGELRHIWVRGIIENRICGDGVRFHDSELWTSVLKAAFPEGGVDARRTERQQQRATNPLRLPFLLTPGAASLAARASSGYLDRLAKLYQAIQSVTGCRVIVDSSKYPLYANVLLHVPIIQLFIVHLVRDSRAVAYSWRRRKRHPEMGTPEALVQRHNPVKSALQWGILNAAARRLRARCPNRYMLLRYEDFVREPRATLQGILRLIDVSPESELPFVDERTVKLGESRAFSGNPGRFRTGAVKLQLDDEWKAQMNRGDRMAVTALTWPQLRRYKYLHD